MPSVLLFSRGLGRAKKSCKVQVLIRTRMCSPILRCRFFVGSLSLPRVPFLVPACARRRHAQAAREA